MLQQIPLLCKCHVCQTNIHSHVQTTMSNWNYSITISLLYFWKKLEENNQIDDFINTITSIACDKLPTTNLAWKSALYRGKMGHVFFNAQYVVGSTLY